MLAFFIPPNGLPNSYRCCLENLLHSFPFFYFHGQQQFSPQWPLLRGLTTCSMPVPIHQMRKYAATLQYPLNYSHPAAGGSHPICPTLVSTVPTPSSAHSPTWVTVGCLQRSHNLPPLTCSLNLTCLKCIRFPREAPLRTCAHSPTCTCLCLVTAFSSSQV